MRSATGKMSVLRFIGVCMFLGFAPMALARDDTAHCDDAFVESVGEGFGFSRKDIVAEACKPWPSNESWNVAAFVYDADVEYGKKQLVAVLDIHDNRIVASYDEIIGEDAVTEVRSDSLWLDTARYILAKNTRAFGLRINAFRDRCMFEGGYDDDLALYVIEGKRLRPVFSEIMRHWSFGPGDRCGWKEEVSTIEAEIFISIEKTSSNGFADLRLSVKSNAKGKPLSMVVRYDGEKYDLAPWHKAFNTWWDFVVSWRDTPQSE